MIVGVFWAIAVAAAVLAQEYPKAGRDGMILCQPITTDVCLDLQYSHTFLPNSFNDILQSVAAQRVLAYKILLNTQCHRALRHFVCSVFIPPCSEQNVPIDKTRYNTTNNFMLEVITKRPCRQFCDQVQTQCEAWLKSNGFDWPNIFNCDQFPNIHDRDQRRRCFAFDDYAYDRDTDALVGLTMEKVFANAVGEPVRESNQPTPPPKPFYTRWLGYPVTEVEFWTFFGITMAIVFLILLIIIILLYKLMAHINKPPKRRTVTGHSTRRSSSDSSADHERDGFVIRNEMTQATTSDTLVSGRNASRNKLDPVEERHDLETHVGSGESLYDLLGGTLPRHYTVIKKYDVALHNSDFADESFTNPLSSSDGAAAADMGGSGGLQMQQPTSIRNYSVTIVMPRESDTCDELHTLLHEDSRKPNQRQSAKNMHRSTLVGEKVDRPEADEEEGLPNASHNSPLTAAAGSATTSPDDRRKILMATNPFNTVEYDANEEKDLFSNGEQFATQFQSKICQKRALAKNMENRPSELGGGGEGGATHHEVTFQHYDSTSKLYLNRKTIEHLSDQIVLKIFSNLRQANLLTAALVCRKWRTLAYAGVLWQKLNLRPNRGGLTVNNLDTFVQLIGLRFNTHLRFIELPCDLAIAEVLHELAQKCSKLRYLTLDFSNAMQLHDYNDLIYFPNNLKYLCLCLSEVIFMEGFMRRIYACLGSLEILHLIGTFELSDEKEEEIYEVINISKIKSSTPNLRVVNFFGINFIDDSHIELLSNNCIHLEALAVNYCLKVRGSSLKVLFSKCKKMKTLLMQHCELRDAAFRQAEWEKTSITELDISSTELNEETLMDVLGRIRCLNFLGVGHCDFFTDKVLNHLIKRGTLAELQSVDMSHTPHLSEEVLSTFLWDAGPLLQGLNLAGKAALGENFWMKTLIRLFNIRILIMGIEDGWFFNLQSKIHIDQVLEQVANYGTCLERLETQWDPDAIKFSGKSGKSIDHFRIRCTKLKSVSLTDSAYYEMFKSNFERSERYQVIRTTTSYRTSLAELLSCFKDLRFN